MFVSEPLQDTADRYDGLVRQLARHRVPTDERCRLPRYRDAILELIGLGVDGYQNVELRKRGQLLDLCFEASEALIALEGVVEQAQLNPVERRCVSRIVRGPDMARDEQVEAGENEPRNLAFELILANKLRASGLAEVCLTEPDVSFLFRDRRIFVACKRPQGDQPSVIAQHRTIRQLASRASSQIAAQLGAHKTNLGLLALDISKFANPKGRELFGQTFEDAQAVLRERNDFFNQHFNADWESIRKSKLHGVLVRFATVMISNEPARFMHAQEWTLTPTRHAGLWDRSKLRGLVNTMAGN
jgi:hypothetical protein